MFTSKGDICRSWCPSFSEYFVLLDTLCVIVMPTRQAAKDVRASQDTLIDVFERIEMFFRRLDVYTAVPPTHEMTDLMIQIMAEVLSILGTATKEIKQGRMSKIFSCKREIVD
jgi:hypothetical protein